MTRTGRLWIKFILLNFIFFRALLAFSAESLSVTIQPEEISLGDTVQILLTIQSTEDFESSDPQVPEIKNLKLIQASNAGQSSSTRMNIINGQTEFSKSVQQQFVFIYQALASGITTIPSFRVNVNGKLISSAPQKISISAQRKKNIQKPRGRPQFQDDENEEDIFSDDSDPFSQLLKQRQRMLEEMQKQLGSGQNQIFGQPFADPRDPPKSRELDVNTNEAFFLYLDADKKEVFEGEQITAQWSIYTRGQIQSLDRAKFPDLRGFWKEIIEEVPSLQFQDEIVNGVPYRKALLASHALFPIKAGTAVIDEFKIKAKVRNLTQFGLGPLSEYTKSSRALNIKVNPLPLQGRPLSFSGAVGQFQMQTQVSGSEFQAQQPISLKVRFEGQGNAKLIELPQIQWPNGLSVYDTKSESKFFKNGQSYKEFDILVIAEKPGEIEIPQINFSYFDPLSKTYMTKSTEPFKLKILEPLPGSSLKSQALKLKENKTQEILNPISEISVSPLAHFYQLNRITLVLFAFILSLSYLVLDFFIRYFKISKSPALKNKIDAKIIKIEKAIKQSQQKVVGAESVNLLYMLAASLAQEKSATKDWSVLMYKMPESYKVQFEAELNQLFEYFQVIGFAPDELKNQALSLDKIEVMIKKLKALSVKIIQEITH